MSIRSQTATAVILLCSVATPHAQTQEAQPYRYELDDSRWVQTQKQRAANALSKGMVDVVVVPFQVDGDSFDAIERNLLARTVAAALRDRAGLDVADVTLVEQALGTGARSIPESAALDLARQLGADTVVLGWIGHDNAGKYHARVEAVGVTDSSGAERRVILDVQGVDFDDTNPPYSSFRTHRREIAAAFGASGALSVPLPSQSRAQRTVPASLEELERNAQQDPVQRAYLLQYLGVLHAQQTQGRERHGLFERSLVALDNQPETPETRALKARAWAYLQRRPLALAALQSTSAEETALRAYLDGDLEHLAETTAQIREPMPRLLATIELERARLSYGGASDVELRDRLATQFPYWEQVLTQALKLSDDWSDRSNALVKGALDEYWPMPQYDLATQVRASVALQKPLTDYDISKLTYDHLNAVPFAARLDGTGPTTADVLELLRQFLVANVVTDITHIASDIGRPSSAVAKATAFALLLAGQPDFVIAQGWAEFARSNELDGTAKSELEAIAYEHLRQGSMWSQGQTSSAETPLTVHHQFFPLAEHLTPADSRQFFFDSDWPNRAGWGWHAATDDDDVQQRLEHCVAYTIQGFQCFLELHGFLTYRRSPEAAAALLTTHSHRFIGHPGRVAFLAREERKAGDDAAANSVVDEAIETGSTDWELYYRRGTDLAKQGKPREALAAYLAYPGFTGTSTTNAVALSNSAFEAGNQLYWAGAYDEARPLYEFAASLETGSFASINGAGRLFLMDGDMETAARYTAESARRYVSAYSLRDLMMFVATLGDRETAWAIFNSMQQEIGEPEFWLGALALHRMEGAPLQQVADWAFQGARATARAGMDSLAMRHLLLLYTMDREITDDLTTTLRERDPGPKMTRDTTGIVYLGDEEISPSRHFGDPPPQVTSSSNYPEKQFDSRLTTMAHALRALQRNDYETAFATLDDASHLYDLEEFLPYYAWAAAQVGKTERVEGYLSGSRTVKERSMRMAIRSVGPLFDEYLSLAFLHGFQGEVDTALDYLVKTNADYRHTDGRAVLTRYQIVEAAEMLYDHTREPRYRAFMLDLARRNTVIEPAFSWPHAFVAKYSEDANERGLALARALHLDPLSRRALSAQPAEIDAARRRIAGENPFVKPSPDFQVSTEGVPLPRLLQ